VFVKFIRKYWLELIVFGIITGVLVNNMLPDYTWINTDSDGTHYTYAAKYLVPAHKTSAPLFLLLGHLFIQLPFGTDAWRFDLLLVLATLIACAFVYLTVKEFTKNKFASCFSAIAYGMSALTISQTTIIDSYALVTMFGIGAYYFAIKKKWLLCAVMLGAGLAVHHLILLILIPLFIAFKELRPSIKKWKISNIKPALITGSFLLFYLYIPIVVLVNHPINMWGNQTWSEYFNDNRSTALMLIGGLGIWDLPKRILDTGLLLVASFWASIVLIGIYFWKIYKTKIWKNLIAWLFVLPIIYYATNLAPQTNVYVLPAIGFGAIICGIVIDKVKSHLLIVVTVFSLFFMVWTNFDYFDIGRTLDKNLSGTKFYREELSKVPDGQILIAQHGWEWASITPHNREYGTNIIGVSLETLASPVYQEWLIENGVKFDKFEDSSAYMINTYIAQSIIEKNENVWITKETDKSTYGAEVVKTTSSDIDLPRVMYDKKDLYVWRWIPDNPYLAITGQIEVEKWKNIVMSNYNMVFFGMLGVIGFVPYWILQQIIVKKKKWSLNGRSVKNECS